MRRRQTAAAPRTAAELVALWTTTQAEARALFTDPETARQYVAAVLAERGTDVVEAIRARRRLRGRRRDGWRW